MLQLPATCLHATGPARQATAKCRCPHQQQLLISSSHGILLGIHAGADSNIFARLVRVSTMPAIATWQRLTCPARRPAVPSSNQLTLRLYATVAQPIMARHVGFWGARLNPGRKTVRNGVFTCSDQQQVDLSRDTHCTVVLMIRSNPGSAPEETSELTQATQDQPVDDEAVYYDMAGECPKGHVYGLGSLRRKKRIYAYPGSSTSQRQFGMTMDGACLSQPPPPPPHKQQQVQTDLVDPPQ
ncbi:hypothetical protein Scep_010369 [Stephania cephalantha]|uniref:Uncharacterized protein n=1 Tax=Stephania cephalantha TaxID=152367 RepID=A0AAP0JW74_9MAGN